MAFGAEVSLPVIFHIYRMLERQGFVEACVGDVSCRTLGNYGMAEVAVL